MQKILSLLFIAQSFLVFTQNDSIHKLDEILLHGSFSNPMNSGFSIKSIPDSTLSNNYLSLGNLLQNEANLYFKQNGNGMVSSISLRGTSASQTGVYWNGIGINSSLNGQTDFNSLDANSFDSVKIRRGGGSVLLGSGAIGGAINLTDKIVFQKNKKAYAFFGYGSYQTYKGQVLGTMSSDKYYAKISLGTSKSENDYPFGNTDLKNENGQFRNYSLNGVFAAQLNSSNSLNLYISYFDNDRNNSRSLTALSESKLLNSDYRVLLDWKHLGDKFTSSLKNAYLFEEFNFIFNHKLQESSIGKSENFVSKYDFSYFLNKNIFFSTGLEYKHQKGWGSNFQEHDQNLLNVYGLFHHQPLMKLTYNASLRKGISSIFEIPFIFAFDAKYDVSKNFTLKSAFSTNYRNPTFNDLYWEPGGNQNLKTEESISMEFGMGYRYKSILLNITSFLIKSSDLIQWQPLTGIIWQPVNIQDVNNYGIEISASYTKRFEQHALQLELLYDYTNSTDLSTQNQLIYVPYHKANTIVQYLFNNWKFSYYLQYTGAVFTTTSNTQSLDPYWISNLDINRSLFEGSLNIGLKINNLFDTNYQSVAYRPMPNRNFSLNINLKI